MKRVKSLTCVAEKEKEKEKDMEKEKEKEKEKRELSSMKRVHSSTSLTEFEFEIQRERKRMKKMSLVCESESESKSEKKRELFAVFESQTSEYGFFIHKIDMIKEGGDSIPGICDDEIRDFGQPIAIPNIPDSPILMSIFSVRSKLYFCGGILKDPPVDVTQVLYTPTIYSLQVYMFDVASNHGSSIQSMNYPKPFPLVFGPDKDHKFYVFSTSDTRRLFKPSMEILDTYSDTWDSVDVPTYLVDDFSYNPASVLCGSDIFLAPYDRRGLYRFCTISRTWSVLKFSLPFEQTSHYLFPITDSFHVLLASPCDYALPELYVSLFGGEIKPLGKVEGLRSKEMPDFLGGWGNMEAFYYLDANKSICVVRSKLLDFIRDHADPEFDGYQHYAIDVYNVNYQVDGFINIKAKVENTLHFKYISKRIMCPRHFFVAG